MIIEPNTMDLAKNMTLPRELGFGKVKAPVMIEADWVNGVWGEFRLTPYHKLELDPMCKVLHYGQEIFEGLKAYANPQGDGHYLFRPMENIKRFNQSAERMAMPEVPHAKFFDGLTTLVKALKPIIPTTSGSSLYLRPFMIATDDLLRIAVSTEFKFMIIASPSEGYVKGGAIKALIEDHYVRAAHGGTGFAKTGGNYAGALNSAIKAAKYDFNQTLWTDAHERQYIEELSGMNFFAVIDGKLTTPVASDTILKGITRDSLIQLARHLKIEVVERPIKISEITAGIKNKTVTECFASGTAAVITPIQLLGDIHGNNYELPVGEIGQLLRKNLLAIQEGTGPDPFGWRLDC